MVNGSANKLSAPPKMLFPVKTNMRTVITNHQPNGSISELQPKSPLDKLNLPARRIPRLIKSPNVIDGHSNNLINENSSSFKLQNGINGHHIFDDLNLPNGKECNLNLLNNVNRQNVQINGNSMKTNIGLRNSNILKSPIFSARVRSEEV